MAILEDLRQKVFLITDRADLVQETDAAIQSALNTAHYSSFFTFDKTTVAILPPANSSQFYISIPNRFRQMKSVVGSVNGKFSEIPSSGLFDKKVHLQKDKVWWNSGSTLTFRCAGKEDAIQIEYYQHPYLQDSFIAANWDSIIVHGAAAKVFAMIDRDDRMKLYNALYLQDLDLLMRSYFDI